MPSMQKIETTHLQIRRGKNSKHSESHDVYLDMRLLNRRCIIALAHQWTERMFNRLRSAILWEKNVELHVIVIVTSFFHDLQPFPSGAFSFHCSVIFFYFQGSLCEIFTFRTMRCCDGICVVAASFFSFLSHQSTYFSCSQEFWRLYSCSAQLCSSLLCANTQTTNLI